ncbi:MAG: alpha/beta hydrolase [Desulfuromonadaceae bacterium]|nr:alpha/beta hydrolase [Desulfuromonadaceae bacterium]
MELVARDGASQHNEVKKATRLILLPGLAADERMYEGIGPLPVRLVTPRLLEPYEDEDMARYARRTAQHLGIGPNDLIGGCSFGSMVAAEIARQQPCQGLILLGGALSSAALGWQAPVLQRIASWLPFSLLQKVLASPWFMQSVFGQASRDEYDLGRTMLLETSEALLRQGGRLAVSYFPRQSVGCPVFALHGGQDRVLKPPNGVDVEIVPEAGHGLVVSHARAVTQFLARFCIQLIV